MDKHFRFSFGEHQMYFTITDDSGNIEEYKTGEDGRGLWQSVRMGYDFWNGMPYYRWCQIDGTDDFDISGKSQTAAEAYIRRWFKDYI